jgi:hypothetical protein
MRNEFLNQFNPEIFKPVYGGSGGGQWVSVEKHIPQIIEPPEFTVTNKQFELICRKKEGYYVETKHDTATGNYGHE